MLGANRYGKSRVRVFKVLGSDTVVDLEAQLLLEGGFAEAHVDGDNSSVIPTDTMRNTIYALAQDHLTTDLERFAGRLVDHFLQSPQVSAASVNLSARPWRSLAPHGFEGSTTERRTAFVRADREGATTSAGIEGLLVLKTTGSAFAGFPRDEYTTLPEAADRLLSTSISARWDYSQLPADTTASWWDVRATVLERFCSDWSASVQHQGYMMGEAVLAAHPEIARIELRLPNRHHLPPGLERLGIEDRGVVFVPTEEPHGDISMEVRR